MSKPKDAILLPIACDLTSTAIADAIDRMDIDITCGAHLFAVKINKINITYSHEVVTEFNRRFDNLVMRADIWEESTDRDEWMLTHIESGKAVYSTGA